MTSDDTDLSYETPDQESVKAILARIGDLQHRRAFYGGLENPNWVLPLDKAGAFNAVPTSEVDEDGYLRRSPWPEGDYLVRMATARPTEVGAILARLVRTEDPYLQALLVNAALQLPPAQAEKLVEPIVHGLEGPHRRILDPMQIAAVIEKLATAGRFKSALQVAAAAYRPRIVRNTPSDEAPGRRNVFAGLSEHWYQETLPSVVVALAAQGLTWLTTLKGWLETFQIAAGNYVAGSPTDTSLIWRPSIGPHEQNPEYQHIGDALVDAVRDCATDLIASGRATPEEVAAILASSEQPLLARVNLCVLGERVRVGDESARAAAIPYLMDPLLMDAGFRYEYAELASVLLPTLSASEAQEWEAMAMAGPPFSAEELAHRSSRWRMEGESDAAASTRYIDLWQLRFLAAIGRNALPAASAARLELLESELFIPEYPRFPIFSETGFVKPQTPFSPEELADKTIREVALLIRDWEPKRGNFDSPSVEGLARALQTDIRARPGAYALSANEFGDVIAPYTNALLAGLSDHVPDMTPDEWDPVLKLGMRIISDSDRPEALFDGTGAEGSDDSGRALLALIQKALDLPPTVPIQANLLAAFLDLLAPLTRHPDPTPAYEAEYGGTNMDPITLSLNSTRPEAISALVQLVARLIESSAEGPPSTLLSPALDALAGRMGPDRDPSLAMAATYGRNIGRLVSVNESWVRTNLVQLLGRPGDAGDASYTDVVVTTALAAHHPFVKLLDLLRPYLRTILKRAAEGEDISVGWRQERKAVELIGDHVVFLVVNGGIDLTDATLHEFFELGSTRDRTSVVGHLGWLLMRSESVPESALGRAKELIDWRFEEFRAGRTEAQEFSQFHWWIQAEKWPEEWWIAHLSEVVPSSHLETDGLLGEHLERASGRFPRQVLTIFARLLANKTEPFERFNLVEHAPGILASAIYSGDHTLQMTARDLMDRLGREGHVTLKDLVEQQNEAKDVAGVDRPKDEQAEPY
jgi:hypothetical protein